MKAFAPTVAVAVLACLVSIASFAAGPNSTATPAYRFPPMVLPVAGPAVPASVTPGAGPETTSAPMVRHASDTTPMATAQSKDNPIEEFFVKAREAFLNMRLKLAAVQIRRGAAVLHTEEAKSTGEVRLELAATAADLERLAQRIEQDKVKAGSELDTAFARADHALARHHAALAKSTGTAIAPATQYQSVSARPDITATAARQGMPAPSKEPINAALAAPEKSGAHTATPSYEDLSRRVDALSRELATLQADLNRIKAQGAGMKN